MCDAVCGSKVVLPSLLESPLPDMESAKILCLWIRMET